MTETGNGAIGKRQDMIQKKNVKLVTHTGCDMSLTEAEELGIEMIPDKVIFEDQEYRNMVDITADEFYEKLQAADTLPTSSQPSMADYVRAFRRAAEEGEEVLCLMITSQMSGCFAAARAAADLVKRQGLEVPLYVYDTQQCSHGMAEMVRAAHEMAETGMRAAEIMERLTGLQHRIGVYFVLESLENARKGGRVGAITARTVSMLGIRPLLRFSDGLVREFGISRNFPAGMKKISEQFIRNGDYDKPVTVFHAAAPRRAQELKKQILESVPQAEIRIEPVGPVIGIYTGTGCAGISFTEKEAL